MSETAIPFACLSPFQQAELYAWYLNLSRAERRRVDLLSDEAFEKAYRRYREIERVAKLRGCVGPYPCGRGAGARGNDLPCGCETP